VTSPKRIFAINLGSTSTKVAYYEDRECVRKDSISHSSEEIRRFPTVFDQTEMRKEVILQP
jgi:butyrate kinase